MQFQQHQPPKYVAFKNFCIVTQFVGISSFAILFANELEFAKCFLSFNQKWRILSLQTHKHIHGMRVLERNPKMSIERCKIVKVREKKVCGQNVFYILVYDFELAQP